MTKVIETSSVDMSAQIFSALEIDGLDKDDQIEINTALSFSKELSKAGEFKEVDGKPYVSLESLGLAMYKLLRTNVGQVSDGSHSFNELYDHRCVLFLCLMCFIAENGAQEYGVTDVWWSEKHAAGDMFEGYVIVGIETAEGQCTYHIKDNPYGEILRQVLSSSATMIRHLDHAPEWDGHDSNDVLARLSSAFLGNQSLKIMQRDTL